MSESACRILGYAAEELIGKPYTKINTTMPNEIGKKFFGPRSVLQEDNYLQMDTFHKHKNGEMIPISILLRIYIPKSGNDEKYILAIASINKSSLEEVNTKAPVLQFVDNACDFYFDIDKQAMTEYISPSAKIVFALLSEDVLGQNYFDFTPVKSIVKAKEAFAYFSIHKQPYRIKSDIQLDTKGKKICSDLYFTPRFDEYGILIGYRVLGWVIKK